MCTEQTDETEGWSVGAPSSTLSPSSFARFASYITRELGITMPAAKLPLVQGRLLRRVRELRLESLDQYKDLFFSQGNGKEREQFINVITTNTTDFFREPRHFEYLMRHAIPGLPAVTLRSECYRPKVWSAGCSTGEEPYTLAMLLSEYAEEHPEWQFGILATDVSTRVLEHARRGIYRESQVAPVPAELRRKYVLRSVDPADRLVRIVPALRRSVSFHRLNFMDAEYPVRDDFDVIFFRNVLIYFDRATQEAVVNRICRHLRPGGYLFVGHSESLAGLKVPVTSVSTAVFRKPL